jgi:hypothetical protein
MIMFYDFLFLPKWQKTFKRFKRFTSLIVHLPPYIQKADPPWVFDFISMPLADLACRKGDIVTWK